MMNERIEELAEQAGFMDSWFSESGDDCEEELRKFAELIIKDCVKQTRNIPTRQEYLGGQMFKYVQVGEVVDSIRLHFGINNG